MIGQLLMRISIETPYLRCVYVKSRNICLPENEEKERNGECNVEQKRYTLFQ